MIEAIEDFYRGATVHWMENSGDRIRKIRKRKKIRQVDLAQAARIDQSTLSLIENGGGMSAETLMGLCSRLEVCPEFIMYGLGDENDSANVLWPFEKIPFARWEKLDDADKGYVQRQLMKAVDECYAGKIESEKVATKAFRAAIVDEESDEEIRKRS